MARATQTTSKKLSVTIKPKSSGSKSTSSNTAKNGTGRKRCPTCGKYM